MAFAFDDGPVEVRAHGTFNVDMTWLAHVAKGGLVYAHNASFELAIWNQIMVPRYGWPALKPEQVRCTMAMAYAMGLPGALENVAPALGIPQRKDSVGKRIMLKWCKPKVDGSMWKPEDDPAQFKALCDYCRQDVEVERAVHGRIMELSGPEQALWELDYKINQRGVCVDMPAINQALKLVDAERRRLDGAMLRTTGGVVGSCTEVQLLVKWIRMQGVEVPGLAKADVLDALSGDLPPAVRAALELRKEAAKSSVAKLQAMKDRASADGRVRGIHQFHGAATGRWAGRGVQPQNLPRPRVSTKPGDLDSMFALLGQPEMLDAVYGPVMDALADMVRGMLIPPPGHDFVAVDFSAVEARVLAWLSREDSVLDVFRAGGDVYKAAASGIYRKPVTEITKDERQIGKVAVLALGYGGGAGAFQSMARNYGVKMTDADADAIKLAWREAHPNIVNFWYQQERLAILAVQDGQLYQHESGVAWKKSGSFLWCRLPSGRVLCYPYPEIRAIETPWGETKDALTYMTVVSNLKAKVLDDPANSGTWKRVATYGGSLAENLTQAVARDLLAEGLIRLEAAGYQVVFHVHDEAVVEIPSRSDNGTLPRIEALMAEVPGWAKGLPLAAEGWRGRRYRK